MGIVKGPDEGYKGEEGRAERLTAKFATTFS
jgi:hypothetical protein